MARKEKFHTFEAEITGRVQEYSAREDQVENINEQISHLNAMKPKNRMHELELIEQLKSLKQQKEAYTDCCTTYLLDIMPHLREYSQCVKDMNTINDDPDTPHKYKMGSVYKNYQLKYNRNVDFEEPIESFKCDIGNTCAECKNTHMIWDSVTSTRICDKCGWSISVLMNEPVNSIFGQTGPVQTKYAYKRINHFNEWLNSFQAKENTTIETDVLDSVAKEFKKNRFIQQEDSTAVRVREYLKKLKFTKHYEHATQIAANISGIPALLISKTQEKRLRSMFQIIQIPFDKVCPKDRKNFPSYSYILHKFCELLEYDEILHKFPLLKSREKLFQLDNIWKDICHELDWEYIKSI